MSTLKSSKTLKVSNLKRKPSESKLRRRIDVSRFDTYRIDTGGSIVVVVDRCEKLEGIRKNEEFLDFQIFIV